MSVGTFFLRRCLTAPARICFELASVRLGRVTNPRLGAPLADEPQTRSNSRPSGWSVAFTYHDHWTLGLSLAV